MRISISVDDPTDPQGNAKTPVTVGWLLTPPTAGVIFDPPRRVRSDLPAQSHAKSASRCPAVLNIENRHFEVACPFDLSLGFRRNDETGDPEIVDLLGDRSPVRLGALGEIIEFTAEAEWRHPDRPMFQIKLPYLFVADEPVYLSQTPPFCHYRRETLPGLMIGGRFPIHVWPRPLMWAFEWHDPDMPVTLKRGEPLFYVQFETTPQDRAVRLVEARRTEALAEYLEHINGAVNYVNQTFSLFEAAEARRPNKLVEAMDRSD